MRKWSLLAAAVVLLVAASPAGAATTRYVTPGGVNSGECATVQTACHYARALNAGGPTDAGDTVLVGAGTYNVSAAEINLTKQITVIGFSFAGRPIITGADPNTTTFTVSPGASGSTVSSLDIRSTALGGRAFLADVAVTARRLSLSSKGTCASFNAANSTLEDSDVTGTGSGYVCVVAAQSNTKLHNVDIESTGSSGSALWFGGPGSSADEVDVASSGTGASLNNAPGAPSATIRRSVVRAANGYGAYVTGGRVVVTDTLLRAYGLKSSALYASYGADAQLRNVTAIATGPESNGLYLDSSPPGSEANLLARNTLARGDQAAIVRAPGKPDPICAAMNPCFMPDHVPGTAGRSHSNAEPTVGGVADLGGNVSGDPSFRDPANGDYRLNAGSPAIDTGTDDPENGTTDLAGGPRKLGAAVDMGAFEFDPGPASSEPAPGTSPGDAPPMPLEPGGPDAVAPFLSDVSVTNRRFRVAAAATPLLARAKRGTKFRYMLSEPAMLSFRIERRAAGRRKGAKCVKPTRRLSRAKRCTRFVAVGTLRRAGAPGTMSVPFSGRIGKKALAIGSYRATVTAVDPTGNRSKPSAVKFSVVRR